MACYVLKYLYIYVFILKVNIENVYVCFLQGCFEKVEEWLDDNKHLLGTIAMCILVVQVILFVTVSLCTCVCVWWRGLYLCISAGSGICMWVFLFRLFVCQVWSNKCGQCPLPDPAVLKYLYLRSSSTLSGKQCFIVCLCVQIMGRHPHIHNMFKCCSV